MSDVIVIGAGIAGLTAAYRLQQAKLEVEVVDRAPVAGGYLRTLQRDGWRHECGPNSFLGSAKALFSLADELDLKPIEARPVAKKRYLFLDGKLQAMPSNPLAALTTGVLPLSAKMRALAEPLTGSKPGEEESIREFFEQRLGREIADRFVDAFVSGIYAADIADTSIAATFPRLFEAVREHKSLFKAAIALASKGRAGTTRRGTFSFQEGLGQLTTALANKLGEHLHLGENVTLEREGNGWRVGDRRAPNVIIATPAYAAGSLLRNAAPGLATELETIRYNPMAGVHLLYRKDAIRKPLDGFGFLVPRREGVRLLGCIWSSALFDVCNSDHFALTCFMGGAHDPAAVTLSEEEIVLAVRRDLLRTLGISQAPVDQAVLRMTKAIPAYGLQHLAMRSRINAQLAGQPGLMLAGNYLEGVSMNDTIMNAERAARLVLTRLDGEKKAA